MPRTVVLLDKMKTQVTNSRAVRLKFPESGDMKTTCPAIWWKGREYRYFDNPKHESDAPGEELYHYLDAAAKDATVTVETPA